MAVNPSKKQVERGIVMKNKYSKAKTRLPMLNKVLEARYVQARSYIVKVIKDECYAIEFTNGSNLYLNFDVNPEVNEDGYHEQPVATFNPSDSDSWSGVCEFASLLTKCGFEVGLSFNGVDAAINIANDEDGYISAWGRFRDDCLN